MEQDEQGQTALKAAQQKNKSKIKSKWLLLVKASTRM